MKIDLHIHTSRLSPDSNLDPDDAIKKARSMGLDGICFTEHDRAWDSSAITELNTLHNFPVFRGVEVMVKEGGEVLIFGLNINFTTVISIKELRNLVTDADGFMIAAHPFRGFPCNTITDFNIASDIVMKRQVFDSVDALEGFNGRNLEGNNILACQLAKKLGLHTSGGSDAHFSDELGKCVTIFQKQIRNEVELLQELKAGRFRGSLNHR
ncbi:MAG: PHP domain-containing protein [Dehalococcoidia bacterium]|nr:PHP domain-containing protein [Dehalococcoidia bacterium]MDD5493054.1 PHP domain-containing protein [Dehalococcoidia bacterium]